VGLLAEIGVDESASNQSVYLRLHPSGWGNVLPCLAIWYLSQGLDRRGWRIAFGPPHYQPKMWGRGFSFSISVDL